MTKATNEFSPSEAEQVANEHFKGLQARCPVCHVGPVTVTTGQIAFRAVQDLHMYCRRCGAAGRWSAERLQNLKLVWTAKEHTDIEAKYWLSTFATCPRDEAILKIEELQLFGLPVVLLVMCPRCGRHFKSSDPVPEGADNRTYASAYTEVKELGSGGMGMVWLVKNAAGTLFAAKRVKEGRLTSPEDIKRFRREMEISKSLRHPALISVHEVFFEERYDVIVMEYLEGGNLTDAINDRKKWSSTTLAGLFRKIAGGLRHLHDKGIVHRDLKAANILLTAKGEPKITDFGLAMLLIRTSEPLTKSGQGLGTELYMSPEQRRNAAAVDQRTDIHNLGLMAYEIITRTSPYEVPIKGVGGRFGPALELALKPDPEERRITPEELADALERHVEEREATTV